MAELERIERAIEVAPVEEMDDEAPHAFVDRTQVLLGKLHTLISETYFL